MARVPECPNVREKVCARSDTVYAGETRDGQGDIIICRTCKLQWIISKPKTVGRAKHENAMDQMRKATELDRERSKRRMIFDYGRKA